MLHDFLTSNHRELVSRCKAKAAKRFPEASAGDAPGVPIFLQQLVDILYREQLTALRVPQETEAAPAHTEIGRAAALHGAGLLRKGYSIDQVVHDYGDVCQAVTELAVEQKAAITVDEFSTLNRCLDNAIADAVTAFASDRDSEISDQTQSLAKDQRRLINMAIHTFSAIKTGKVGACGAAGFVHLNTLAKLRDLIG